MHTRRLHRSTVTVASFSLLAVMGCSDAKAPTDTGNRLALKPGVSFPILIHTTATVRDDKGEFKSFEWETEKIVRVVKERGKAKVEMLTAAPRRHNTPVQLAALSNVSSAALQSMVDTTTFVPITAVPTGDYTGNFDVLDVAEDGNRVRTSTTSVGGAPYSDVRVYQNAALVGSIHSDWTPVYGGHILSSQKQMNWATDGALALTITSNISLNYTATFSPAVAAKSTMTDFFSVALEKLGKGVECVVAPKPAYAQYRAGDRYCWQEGVVWATLTAVIAFDLWRWTRMPRNWFAGAAEIAAFKTEVAGWTYAMYEYLWCMNAAKKAGKKP